MMLKKFVYSGFLISSIFYMSCEKKTQDTNMSTVQNSTVTQYVTTGPKGSTDGYGCLVVPVNDSLKHINRLDTINSLVLYRFRDEFLDGIQPNAGTRKSKYIEMYYEIGQFCLKYDIYNESTFSSFYSLLKYAEQVSEVTLNGQNTDVVVTNSIYNFCRDQSVIIHNNPHFSEIQPTIDELDSDLEYLKGKNKAEFTAFFQ